MSIRRSIKLALSVSMSVFALAACNGGGSDGHVQVVTGITTTTTTGSSLPSRPIETQPVPVPVTTVIVDQPIIDNTVTVINPPVVIQQIVENPTVSVPYSTDTSSSSSYSSGYDSSSGSSYDSSNDYSSGDSYDSSSSGDSYYSAGDSSGGCDSSGCNSFGSGGSKNTGLLAAKVTKAQMTAKANSVASQFEMSFDSAYKLTQLASQVQGMKQQRQMTQADRDAVVQSAFKIAGVSQTEVSNAVAAQMQTGNTKAIEDVMSKAAQNLGMPSGQTFRDKLLPLFGN